MPEQPNESNKRDGLWSTLERRLSAIPETDINLSHTLTQQTTNPAIDNSTKLWQALRSRTDPAKYCPHTLPDIPEESVLEDGHKVIVIRSPTGSYVRLTPEQHHVWSQMDGTHTIAQLATETFLRDGVLLPLGDFVTTLQQGGFLVDQPVNIYGQINAALEKRTAEGWGRRIIHTLMGRRLEIRNIDTLYGNIYRWFGRFFFTRAFLLLWVIIVLAGTGAFVALLLGGRETTLITSENAISVELIVLWFAIALSFLFHESAHALAVKHYRRTLHSGGFMLYFGMPACFVDTSDIWRSPRHARMIVSVAGLIADLFLGAIAALFTYMYPEDILSSAAYKFALVSYVTTLFNLNPLLEFDGYFLLIDWKRLPNLRRRALEFVRGPLWSKHKTLDGHMIGIEHPRALLRLLTQQERIFVLYGALSVGYTIVALVFAGLFWQAQLQVIIQSLWSSQFLFQQVLAVVIVLLVAIPLSTVLFLGALSTGLVGWRWMLQHGYGRHPTLMAGLALALVLGLGLLTNQFGESLWIEVIPLGLWAIALGGVLLIRTDYQGAAALTAINAFTIMTVFAGGAATVRLLLEMNGLAVPVDGVAFIFLLIAGYMLLLDVDLRHAPPRDLYITALLLMLAFGIGGIALFSAMDNWPDLPRWAYLIAGAPGYFGAVAFALFIPHLIGLYDSRLFWAWALTWLASLLQTIDYIVNLETRILWLDTIVAGTWAAAWIVHLATLRQITLHELEWVVQPAINEQQRLMQGFQRFYAGCYQLLRSVYGSRRAQFLDDHMDVLAATANWDITLDRDQARVGRVTKQLEIERQGARYAEVLRYTIKTIEDLTGTGFAYRVIQAAYDALPWSERETANRYAFPTTPWANQLSLGFHDERTQRLRFLRQIDLFLLCNDHQLDILNHNLCEFRYSTGVTIPQSVNGISGVWIVDSGEVIVERRGQVVDELHRGSWFGGETTPDGGSTLTYRASITSELLFAPEPIIHAVTHRQTSATDYGFAALTRLRLLEGIPLFASLPRDTLQQLVQHAHHHTFDKHQVIVQKGVVNGTLYVVMQGEAIVVEQSSENGGNPQLVARLGPKEFFGEIELLRGTPPSAHVIARSKLEVLALPHSLIQNHILSHTDAAQRLERIGSGRLIDLRQKSVG